MAQKPIGSKPAASGGTLEGSYRVINRGTPDDNLEAQTWAAPPSGNALIDPTAEADRRRRRQDVLATAGVVDPSSLLDTGVRMADLAMDSTAVAKRLIAQVKRLNRFGTLTYGSGTMPTMSSINPDAAGQSGFAGTTDAALLVTAACVNNLQQALDALERCAGVASSGE